MTENIQPTTFQENTPDVATSFDHLNQCMNCNKRAGQRLDPVTAELSGAYLIKDARGFKLCSICIKRNPELLMKEQKLTKVEKKRFKKFKREVMLPKELKHITVDAKGNVV
jgi:hypothetical protein